MINMMMTAVNSRNSRRSAESKKREDSVAEIQRRISSRAVLSGIDSSAEIELDRGSIIDEERRRSGPIEEEPADVKDG